MSADEVPTLDRCQRLKELGMPQGTAFHWTDYGEEHEWHIIADWFLNSDVAAPLATEMLRWLPCRILYKQVEWSPGINDHLWSFMTIVKHKGFYTAAYDGITTTIADALPNALADLLIWCVEQGHVKWEKGEKDD